MNEEENKPIDLSEVPLGEFPAEQVKKNTQESVQRRLEVEYLDLSAHPEFQKSVNDVRDNIKKETSRLGVEIEEDNWPELRFIDNSNWNNVAVSAGHIDKVGGFYDRGSNVAYIEADLDNFDKDIDSRVRNIYIATHETLHAVIPIEDYSFHLSEGIVDSLSVRILNETMPVDEETKARERYLLSGSSIYVLIEGESHLHESSYHSQILVLEKMRKKMGDTNFDLLLRRSFEGDIDGIRDILKTHLGEAMESKIADNDVNNRDNNLREIHRLMYDEN